MTARGADFWSRRKAAVAAEEARLARARADDAGPVRQDASPEDARSDAEILAELDLPHPDELGPGDDFRAYLDKAVPQRIRRLALRRLWRLNPTLANLDGMLEYGEDYTDTATVVENLQTAFDLARGILSTAAVDEPEGPEEGGDDATAEAGPAGEDAAPVPEVASASACTPDAAPVTAAAEEGPGASRTLPPRRRRMSFDFSDAARAASDQGTAQA